MPDRRMQRVEQRRGYAASVGRRSVRFASADPPGGRVRQGWQLFSIGLVALLVGLGVTVFSLRDGAASVALAMIPVILVGVTLVVRGLASVSGVKRLAAGQAPLDAREPWLLAPAAFAADGGAAEPGWLADPLRPGGLRFWDGQDWTADTRPG
jgi:hypothetical protein